MKAFSQFADFLHTRLGLINVGLAAVLLVIAFLPSSKPRNPAGAASSPTLPLPTSSNLHLSLTRPTIPVAPLPVRAASATNNRPVIYAVHVDSNTVVASGAPFGRLLQCQLVNTLESLTPGTPIIGLVTEDLWFKGQVLVPAGSEIHGQALPDRVRERITASGKWVIVLSSGEQLTLSGIALDRELDARGSGWGITDGSAGIRGQILRTDSLAEVKLFLATALSGLADGLRQTERTPFGFTMGRSARNVAQSGASAVLNTYAAQILEAIKRDGLYVRVPAGKQFYVYVQEPIHAP